MRVPAAFLAILLAPVASAAVKPQTITTCAQFETMAAAGRTNFSNIPLETRGKMRVTAQPLAQAMECMAFPAVSSARRPSLVCRYDVPGSTYDAVVAARGGELKRLGNLLRQCRPGLVPRQPPKAPADSRALQAAFSNRDGSETWHFSAIAPPMVAAQMLVVAEIKASPGREAYRAPAKGLSPAILARAVLWQDCPGYQKTQDMLRAGFADVETLQSDGREMQTSPADPMSQCIVGRASPEKPDPSLVCIWTKYGAENQTWAKAEFNRRVKSLTECRSRAKPVLVLPQGRLGSDEQAHFMADANSESWSIGYGRQGDTWYVELHAYGKVN